jgi:hypothetical protein
MVRRRTLNALADMGPQAKALLPAVREALKDNAPEVGMAAAEAFDQIQKR